MLYSKCSQCGCTGIHACMGKPPSDGVVYASYGNLELKALATKEIQDLLTEVVDKDAYNLVS